MSRLLPLLVVFSFSLPAAHVHAQSSTRGTTPQGSARRGGQVVPGSSVRQQVPVQTQRGAKTFEEKLWDFLIAGKYRNWAPVPGKSDAMYAGQSPHGAHLKMYLNRRAAGNPQTLPDKSIVIKENYGPDQKKLMAITVMFRSKGFSPSAGDWYWVKYLPNGKVDQKATPNGPVRLAGQVQGCIDCHRGADGGDFAFFNDDLRER